MKLKKGFVLREVFGEKVILGEGIDAVNFGKLLALNETAAYMWEMASKMGDFTVEALAEGLCKEYDVTPEVAHRDVTAILEEWRQLGVAE